MLNECECTGDVVVCPDSGTCITCSKFAPSALRRVQEASLRRFAVDVVDARLQYRRRIAYQAAQN